MLNFFFRQRDFCFLLSHALQEKYGTSHSFKSQENSALWTNKLFIVANHFARHSPKVLPTNGANQTPTCKHSFLLGSVTFKFQIPMLFIQDPCRTKFRVSKMKWYVASISSIKKKGIDYTFLRDVDVRPMNINIDPLPWNTKNRTNVSLQLIQLNDNYDT